MTLLQARAFCVIKKAYSSRPCLTILRFLMSVFFFLIPAQQSLALCTGPIAGYSSLNTNWVERLPLLREVREIHV